MSKSFVGEVRDGVVVFDGPEVPLPSGTRVRIEPLTSEGPTPSVADRYASVIGILEDLPPDLASEHDHYIHGVPRRDER